MTAWLSDHMTASGSTELSDFVDLSLSESEESSLPSTSDSGSSVANKTVLLLSHKMPLISESHFIELLE